ncbi:MAG: HAD family hydrolase [Planctomycetaceae bacterium]|nr:HAD family hydrolase [Planctomycetaceae bacterium]
MPLRLAVWSGPRNISTALMRSWGNRADTFVVDEPLYAHYLKVTGLPHPGVDEIIEHHEADWQKVAAWLTGPAPQGRAIFYQKHMAHHLLPEIERDWLSNLTHVFLIRDPKEMLTSLIKVLPEPRVEDTGLPQQVELLERVQRETGSTPPVFDSKDILDAPGPMLRAMCAAVGVPFDDAMLNWPRGPRPTDGIWAKHWYAEVEKSTGFKPFKPKDEPVPNRLNPVYEQCVELYDVLNAHRVTAS